VDGYPEVVLTQQSEQAPKQAQKSANRERLGGG